MSRFVECCLVACALALVSPAVAQSDVAVRLTVDNVPDATGQVMASLCDDPAARIPGPCRTYAAKAAAQAGATVLTFTGVKPGTYSVQVFHDRNGNGAFDFPQEGYAYGNDAPFPPSSKAAAIIVTGETGAVVHLVNTFANGTVGQGTRGVEAPAGVTKTDLRSNGLYGELYMPRHDAPLPLVIAIGGSEGGLDTMSAFTVPLTAHGYAVLALAYWKEPGLPRSLEGVPLEYFDRAVSWAKAQPGIAPTHIAILGWSRGAEAALLAASRNADIRAVVAVSPSAYVWQGLNFSNGGTSKPAWQVAGAPLPPLVPANGRGGDRMAQMFLDKLPDAVGRPETVIPVEKINGPVLLLSGSDDALWPSSLMSDRIIARLQANHFGFEARHRNFDGAGHAVFLGDPSAMAGLNNATMEKFMGGSTEANAKARAASWTLVLDFLRRALR